MECPVCASPLPSLSQATTEITSQPIDPQTARKSELAAIQKDILALELLIDTCRERLSVLKLRQNTLASVWCLLPTELLEKIIGYLASPNDSTQRSSFDWIVMTHVCASWRQVALSTPKLWARPDLRNHDCARVMLKRASSCPLTFELPLDISNWQWNIQSFVNARKLVFDNFHRAGALIIFDDQRGSPSGGLQEFVNDLLHFSNYRQQAISLESLVVHRNSGELTGIQTSLFNYIGTPNNPHLRNISLHNWNIFGLPRLQGSPSLSSLSNITTLENHVALSEIFQRVPTHQVLRCLGQLPRLEILSLKNVCSPITVDDRRTLFRPIHLPHLHRLHLTDSASACNVLLESVNFLSIMDFSLVCHAEYDKRIMYDYVHFLRAIAAKIRGNIKILRLEFDHSKGLPDTIKVELWHQHGPNEADLESPDITFHSPPSKTSMDYIIQIMEILPVEDMEQVFYLIPISNPEFWAKLGRLARLSIMAIGSNHPDLLDVLGSSGTGEDLDQCTYPALNHLVFRKWDFFAEYISPDDQIRADSSTSFDPSCRKGRVLEAFVLTMVSRRKLGHGPIWLDLVDCSGLSEVDIQFFEQLFEDFQYIELDGATRDIELDEAFQDFELYEA